MWADPKMCSCSFASFHLSLSILSTWPAGFCSKNLLLTNFHGKPNKTWHVCVLAKSLKHSQFHRNTAGRDCNWPAWLICQPLINGWSVGGTYMRLPCQLLWWMEYEWEPRTTRRKVGKIPKSISPEEVGYSHWKNKEINGHDWETVDFFMARRLVADVL